MYSLQLRHTAWTILVRIVRTKALAIPPAPWLVVKSGASRGIAVIAIRHDLQILAGLCVLPAYRSAAAAPVDGELGFRAKKCAARVLGDVRNGVQPSIVAPTKPATPSIRKCSDGD